jgi:hypothetical protein
MRKIIAIWIVLLMASLAFGQEAYLPVSKRFNPYQRFCEPMSILDGSKVKTGGGQQVFQIGCDMPVSTTDDILILIVAFVQYRDFSATMETPDGWTGGDLTDQTAGIALYYRTGGHTAPVTINFTGNDVCAAAICFTVSEQASSGALTLGSSHSSGGFLHVCSGLTPAPAANAILLFAVTSPDSNTAFDVANDNSLASIDGGMTRLAIPPYVTGGSNSICIGYRTIGVEGDPGTVSFSSRSTFNPTTKAANALGIGVWITPSQAPSAPVWITPTIGQLFAIGREIPLAWNAATDPNIAASALTYDIEFTTNGITWTTLDTTGAGITSYPWDSAGLSPSINVQARCRADNGTETGAWGYSSIFTFLADAAPGAPGDVRPTGIVNQEEDLTVLFTFNDPGDLQAALEIEWSTSPTMSSPSTTGTVATSDAFYTFTASTDILATATTIYYRVRNQGLVDGTNGAWSAIKTLQVTAPISPPNITFPTNASPPTSGTVTATFTGTGHAKIKYVIDRETIPVFFSPDIITSGNSFLIDFDFANDTNYTLNLQRAASDGLWSTIDSETFLVSYVGPEQPVVTATAIDEAGYVQILIENPDAPEGQYIFINGVLLDTPLLSPNTVFNYAGATSGEEIEIVVRAYAPITFGYTGSEPVTVTQNLQSLFLFEPTKESTTANFIAAPIQILNDSNEPEINTNSAMVKLRKRTKQVAHFGRGSWDVLSYSVMAPIASISVIDQLESWLENGTTIRARDNFAHNIAGNITTLDIADFINRITTPLVITQNNYEERVE